jgi:hypothetical protein
MPVNMGIKVLHGNGLANGLKFYDSFLATFWWNYLAKKLTHGQNEQMAMSMVLRVSCENPSSRPL